jgi:hypothetical protein
MSKLEKARRLAGLVLLVSAQTAVIVCIGIVSGLLPY